MTTAKSGEDDSSVIDLAGSIDGDDDTIKTVDSIWLDVKIKLLKDGG